MSEVALSYQEPGIILILVQSSFLILLNVVGATIDHYFYCGLVAQVLLGMAWGTPGAHLLSNAFQQAVTQIGYLGLIAIIFEGGLSTSARAIQHTLLLSICVALTGIIVPIGLSFSLRSLSSASNLQAFAAGAALCSTSLGTTFNLLKTTKLTSTRLGVVLTSAAMLDDVVGLIMLQIISNLGSNHDSFEATTVMRPVFVSIGFAIVLVLFCKYACIPIMHLAPVPQMVRHLLANPAIYFVGCTSLLLALITSASYAGTSVLFATYLAGASISWIGAKHAEEKRHPQENESNHQELRESTTTPSTKVIVSRSNSNKQGQLASGDDVDKISSLSSNTAQGHRARQEPTPPPESDIPRTSNPPGISSDATKIRPFEQDSRSLRMYRDYYAPSVEHILKPFFFASIGFSIPITRMFRGPVFWRGVVYAILMGLGKLSCGLWLLRLSTAPKNTSGVNKNKRTPKSFPRPKSLYPASVLGCAMIARGEIGFLISALAATNGIFKAEDKAEGTATVDTELYLIVTWAILLCTVVGPVTLGLVVRRLRRLQQQGPGPDGGKENPLGTWAVS